MNVMFNAHPNIILDKVSAILEQEIERAVIDPREAIFVTFRDPRYGPKTDGYHTVQVMIVWGEILFVSDYAYFDADLGIDLEYDFGAGTFQQQGRQYPISRGLALFRLWQQNFCTFYEEKAYQVEVANDRNHTSKAYLP